MFDLRLRSNGRLAGSLCESVVSGGQAVREPHRANQAYAQISKHGKTGLIRYQSVIKKERERLDNGLTK
jgi:hypothetical protein